MADTALRVQEREAFQEWHEACDERVKAEMRSKEAHERWYVAYFALTEDARANRRRERGRRETSVATA